MAQDKLAQGKMAQACRCRRTPPMASQTPVFRWMQSYACTILPCANLSCATRLAHTPYAWHFDLNMKVNHCAVQQQSALASFEEMRRENVSIFGDRKELLVCPKPRRLGLLNPGACDPVRPLRLHLNYQADSGDLKAGNDLLDIILSKGGYGGEHSYGQQVASSPPFFCGSPPSRVSNPLIRDTRFGDEKFVPISPRSIPVPSGLAMPSPNSCVRANFGNNPTVRIEGFECMGRDNRRTRSIPALA